MKRITAFFFFLLYTPELICKINVQFYSHFLIFTCSFSAFKEIFYLLIKYTHFSFLTKFLLVCKLFFNSYSNSLSIIAGTKYCTPLTISLSHLTRKRQKLVCCKEDGGREEHRNVKLTGDRYQFSSVTQSCLTLCNPMNCSTTGLPVHHQLPEFTQTHVHPVGDAIQPSHPLSSPSPPAPNPSQHQSLFQ